MFKRVALAFAPLLILLVLGSLDGRSSVGAPIATTSGNVIGHPATNRTGVTEFLGIRYAAAANGTLRFQPPVPYKSSLTYAAEEYSPACPYNPSPPLPTFPNKTTNFDRIYGAFTGQGGKTFSEDCLALNIWVKDADPKQPKPVIFFIHGGRFSTGTANITFYQGQYVADTGDVVVVNINYRLQLLGFSGAPGLTQNVGILDQRLALEWVRSNIASFGGDPNKITIYGQSAGGLSVDYHTYAWPDDPIASSVMSISGTAASVLPNTALLSSQYWYNLSGIVGCPTSGNAVPCMQNQTFEALLTGLTKLPFAPTKALFQPQFQETIDEVVVFSDYAARGKTGKFARIPYLVGNAHNEAGFYKLAAFSTNITLNTTQWDIFNLEAFTCASSIEAANRVAFNVTTYRYRYFGNWQNLILYPGSGAYHGSDLNMWHGVGQDVSGEANSEPENQLSAYMIKALTTFAADPGNGLAGMGWPKYAVDGSPTLVKLGFKDETTASFAAPRTYDEGCAVLDGDTSLSQGAF